MKNNPTLKLRHLFARTDVEAVAVDADDTLWYDSRYFAVLREAYLTSCRCAGIASNTALSELARHEHIAQPGDAGYCSAIRHAAHSLELNPKLVEDVELACRRFVSRDLELLEGVRETLVVLQPFRIAVVTKGDVEEQRRKIERSMLQDLISDVQILQGKTVEYWADAFRNIECNPSRAIVIGNSIRHDIGPAVSLGAAALWFNHAENFNGRNGELPSQACEVSGWPQILQAIKRK